MSGSAEFQNVRSAEYGSRIWFSPTTFFVTGSKTPYELRWRSAEGQEMDVIQIHLASEQYILPAFQKMFNEMSAAGTWR